MHGIFDVVVFGTLNLTKVEGVSSSDDTDVVIGCRWIDEN